MRSRWLPVTIGILSCVLAACSGDDDGGHTQQTLAEPPEFVSRDGALHGTLTVAQNTINVAGQSVMASVYNDLFVPPTLRVRPGDTIFLTLRNRIAQQTNLHYHGMNVSPLDNSDNVFIHVNPTDDFDYQVKIPTDHPMGLFYYHAHMHGLTEFQIGSGMSGGLVVDGILDSFPQLRDVTRRVMLLKDIQIRNGRVPDPPDSGEATMRTLNGQVNPLINIRPGETQLWSIGNIGADIYYHLSMDGLVFYEIARDGNPHTKVVARTELFLPTSSRVDVLVQGPSEGRYALNTMAIDMGPQGDMYPEVTLGTLVSSGAAEAPVVLPTDFLPVENLRGKPIAMRRTFTFFEDDSGDQFFINGQQFNPDVVNTRVTLGDIEEWTINNCSGENHVFHIHQLDFQVIEINGVEQPFIGRQDTVNLDYRDTDGPEDCPTDSDPHGRVKVLIPFTNPVILGKFVYHCHIGEHEDNGMMQVIEVVDDSGGPLEGPGHGHH